MDRQIVFARTNKGHKEVAGRTTFLKAADRSVLFLFTGKESLREIESRIDPSIAKRLDSVVQRLLREQFIHVPEPHEISAPPERIQIGERLAVGSRDSGSIVTMEPPETLPEPEANPAADDLVNAVLQQAKESSRRQGLVERMRQMESDARKKAAAPKATEARGMVLPAKRLQAAFSAHSEAPAAEPVLDPKRILARSGKGALEFIGRTCTLRPGLQKILAQVDGVSTVDEIQRRIGHSDKAVASGLDTLLKRGYIQDSAAVLEGLEPDIDFDANVSARGPQTISPGTEPLAPADIQALEAERSTLADVWRELAAQQRRDLAAHAEEVSRAARQSEEYIDRVETDAPVRSSPRASRREERSAEPAAMFERYAPRPAADGDWASEQFARRTRARKVEPKQGVLAKRAAAPIAAIAVLLAIVGYLLAPFFDTARYEVAAGQYFDEPVRIGGASLTLWPRPAVRLSDLRIGDERSGLRIESAYARIGLEWLTGSELVVPLLEIDGAIVTTTELRKLLKPSAQGNAQALTLRRIEARRIHILDATWKFNNANIDVEIGRNHAVRRLTVSSADGALKAQFLPSADGSINLEISAAKMALPGTALVIDQFDARGSYTTDEFLLREFDGRLLGGVVNGQARIRQGANWVAEGTFEARGVDLAQAAKPLFDDGTLSAKGRFRTSANTPHELFAGGSVEGALSVDRGTFNGADLSRVVLREDSPRGVTPLTELTAGFSAQLGSRLSIANVRFKSNRVAGTASAQVDGNGALRAQIAGSLWTPQGQVSNGVDLGGTVRRPVIVGRKD